MNNRIAGVEGVGGATSAGQNEWTSKSQAQEFRDRVKQLQQGGWSVDTIASRLGYRHGRSLWKALAKGRIRRPMFDALMGLPQRANGGAAAPRGATTAKPAPKAAGKATLAAATKTGAATKTAPTAKTGSMAKTASKATAASRPSPTTKTAPRPRSGGAKSAERPSRGAASYLDLARRYLNIARDEVQKAGTASPLLEPGLRDVLGEIDAISSRLSL